MFRDELSARGGEGATGGDEPSTRVVELSALGLEQSEVGPEPAEIGTEYAAIGRERAMRGSDVSAIRTEQVMLDPESSEIVREFETHGVQLSELGSERSQIGPDSSALGLESADVGSELAKIGYESAELGLELATFGLRSEAFAFESAVIGVAVSKGRNELAALFTKVRLLPADRAALCDERRKLSADPAHLVDEQVPLDTPCAAFAGARRVFHGEGASVVADCTCFGGEGRRRGRDRARASRVLAVCASERAQLVGEGRALHAKERDLAQMQRPLPFARFLIAAPRAGIAAPRRQVSIVLWLFSALALMAIAVVVGTDRLGRPFTDEERKRFGALLSQHDYPGARLVALRFAHKLCGGRRRSAIDLVGRVDLRLVRFGWDPAEIPLVRALCRFVWSEWTHATSETETSRKAEEGYLRELQATEGVAVPSIEKRVTEEEARAQERAAAQSRLGKLRAAFEKAGDQVNLVWLEYTMEREMDAKEMAERAGQGRSVADFYAAAKRRKRVVARILAEENGVAWVEGA